MTHGAILALGIAACALSEAAGTQGTPRLSAPTYYIAVSAQLDVGDIVHLRGATNLPAGASVALQIVAPNGGGWKEYSKVACVVTSEGGLFDQDLDIPVGLPHRTDLFARATFLTNACKQSVRVLQVVGGQGEFLGNDAHRPTMHEVEMAFTPGMAKNPQLFQVSGPYFGIEAFARVD